MRKNYNEKLKQYMFQVNLGRDENGKYIRKTVYGKTKKIALEKLDSLKAKYALGVYADGKGLTLGEWLTRWFETYKIHDYKKNTYQIETRRSKSITSAPIGSMKLDKIRPCDVQDFVNSLTVSPKTIKNIMILLNGAMKQAVAEGYIVVNPCTSVTTPKQVKPDMVAMDKTEKEIFLEHAKNNPYYDIFLFALNTGMRESEICGLTRDCIDFTKGFITVKQQLVKLKGSYILDTPKTKNSIRQVPINDTVKQILEKFMFGSYVSKDYVFYNPSNRRMLKQSALSSNIKIVANKCYETTKIEKFKKLTFHSLRHTFATQWIVQGGNVVLLSKTLGHTDTSFTTRVYVQPSNNDIKTEMLSMNF